MAFSTARHEAQEIFWLSSEEHLALPIPFLQRKKNSIALIIYLK